MYSNKELIKDITDLTSQRNFKTLTFSLLKCIHNIMDCIQSDFVLFNNQGCILLHTCIESENIKNKSVFNNHNFTLDYLSNSLNENLFESNVYNGELKLIKLLRQDSNEKQFIILNFAQKIKKDSYDHILGVIDIYNNSFSLLKESRIDVLTGLLNRNTFDLEIADFFIEPSKLTNVVINNQRFLDKVTQKTHSRFWLTIIDIDDFKLINDKYGHMHGDTVLVHFSKLLKSAFRQSDIIFRYGGDEFIVIIEAESEPKCSKIIDRFLNNVRAYNFPTISKVTLSIGVIEFKENIHYTKQIKQVDQALYNSKYSGKNKISFYK